MTDMHSRIAEVLHDLGIRMDEREVAEVAKQSKANKEALQFTDNLLDLVVRKKKARSVETLRKFSRIPVHKRLEDFDFSFQPNIDEKAIRRLATLGFVHNAENVILIGNPGSGKSHLAIALAEECLDNGMRAYYITMSDLALKLTEAKQEGRLKKVMSSLQRADCLIIDELGYDRLSQDAAELVFHLVSARYERKSVIVTSNFPISRWNEVFGNEAITQVVADRLVHHAEIIRINGPSYRLKDHL